MDTKLSYEMKALQDRIGKLESTLFEMKRIIDEMHREMGTKNGREIYRQVDELYNEAKANEEKLNHVVRDVTAIRKTVEYGDTNIKEIQQALALIYRNTDELEEHMMGDDRQTK